MTMESGIIQAFYGTGKGKTSAAVGQALRRTPAWTEDHDDPVSEGKGCRRVSGFRPA